MIVGHQKPIAEIMQMVGSSPKLLVLGCGTCVKTCFAGGEDEVAVLSSLLRMAGKKEGKDIEIEELTVERQCEDGFIKDAAPATAGCASILSLACGAGVQAVARRFPNIPVFPGLNTTFIGVLERQGVFTEECLGCGDCKLGIFGGICPVTKCSKRLLNGPCGGSRSGKCEVSPQTDCAWQRIIDRLRALDRLDMLRSYIPPKNWRTSHAGGPRTLVREDHII